MKTILLNIVIAAVSLATSMIAAAEGATILGEATEPIELIVGANSIVDLKVDKPALSLQIRYPGRFSNVCGLKFATSLDLPYWQEQRALANRLIVTQQGEVIKPSLEEHFHSALTYTLPQLDGFVSSVLIETKDGNNLKTVIEEIFDTGDYLALFSTLPCL